MPDPHRDSRMAMILAAAAASAGCIIVGADTLIDTERRERNTYRYDATRTGRTREPISNDPTHISAVDDLLDLRSGPMLNRVRDALGFYHDAPRPRAVVTHTHEPEPMSKRAKRRARGRA